VFPILLVIPWGLEKETPMVLSLELQMAPWKGYRWEVSFDLHLVDQLKILLDVPMVYHLVSLKETLKGQLWRGDLSALMLVFVLENGMVFPRVHQKALWKEQELVSNLEILSGQISGLLKGAVLEIGRVGLAWQKG
jgi:hypothetical protein